MALYGAETWTLRAADQKYLEGFEMWCWRRMEKIGWTDHVRNEEVLLRVNEQRNILQEIRKRKANWIGHIWRRNCLLKQVIEGKIEWEMEVARRRGRRRKKLLDDLKDRRGYSHWRRRLWIALYGGIVLEEALDLSSDGILNEWIRTLPWLSYKSDEVCEPNYFSLQFKVKFFPLEVILFFTCGTKHFL